MKMNLYNVNLDGHSVQVWAFNKNEAVILAQAEAINYGRKYELLNIIRIR